MNNRVVCAAKCINSLTSERCRLEEEEKINSGAYRNYIQIDSHPSGVMTATYQGRDYVPECYHEFMSCHLPNAEPQTPQLILNRHKQSLN